MSCGCSVVLSVFMLLSLNRRATTGKFSIILFATEVGGNQSCLAKKMEAMEFVNVAFLGRLLADLGLKNTFFKAVTLRF